MKLFIEETSETKTIAFNGTAKQLLQELALNPETVLVARNNELVTEDEHLHDEDEIKILSVISGG